MKEEFCRRPLLVAFLGLCAGLSSGFHWSNPLFVVLLLPLVWRRPSQWVLLVSVLIGVIARPEPQPRVLVQRGVFSGDARVIEVPATGRSYLSTIVEAKGKRYRLLLPKESDANVGDTIRLRADILPLKPDWMSQRLEIATLRPTGDIDTLSHGPAFWKASMRLRGSFLAFVEDRATPALVGMLEALCLNVTSDIGEDLYDNLKRTGTVHIVSASGFHVALVTFAVAWVFLALPVPRWAQLVMLAVVLGFYAAAAGFHAPMLRSAVMVLVGSLAYLVKREPDGVSALSVAGLVDLACRPEDVANIGFQLSFLAVGALILFGGNFLNQPRTGIVEEVKVRAATLVWSSLVAMAGTTPLVAYTFGQVSFVSVLSNLLVVPLLPFAVVGCLGSWIASFVSLPVAVGALKSIVEPSTGLILAVVESTGQWPWASVQVPAFSPYWVLAAYVCLFALYSPKRRMPEAPNF